MALCLIYERGFQKFCRFWLFKCYCAPGDWCLCAGAQYNWPMRYDNNNSDTAQSLSDAKIANFRTQQKLNCLLKTKREMLSFLKYFLWKTKSCFFSSNLNRHQHLLVLFFGYEEGALEGHSHLCLSVCLFIKLIYSPFKSQPLTFLQADCTQFAQRFHTAKP